MAQRIAVGRVWAAGTVVAASALVIGCVSTVDGTPVRGQATGPLGAAPLTEAQLDGVLLSIGELNGIIGSTQMTVTSELDEMTDHADEVSDPYCLGAIYGAEDPVYAGYGWTAVRDQVAREPDDDNEHWVEQTAVLYPEAENAQAFVDESTAIWEECANSAIAVGDGDYLWALGDVEIDSSLITQMTTQEGADGWACQHALSLVANVTVEAWACGYAIGDEAAEIVRSMVDNATK